jgi:hypothetical protein
MRSALQLIASITVLGAFAGCASYTPVQGGDAQTVRLRISQAGMLQLVPFIQPVAEDGKCGDRFSGPALSPKAPAAQSTAAGSFTPAPRTLPREGMFDAPAPDQTQAVELRLNAGRYRINSTGSTGGFPIMFACSFSSEVVLQAGEQYWLDLKAEEGLCKTNFSRVENSGNKSRWVPMSVTSAKNSVCVK